MLASVSNGHLDDTLGIVIISIISFAVRLLVTVHANHSPIYLTDHVLWLQGYPLVRERGVDSQCDCVYHHVGSWGQTSFKCPAASAGNCGFCGHFCHHDRLQRNQLVHDDTRLRSLPQLTSIKVSFILLADVDPSYVYCSMRIFIYTYLGFFVASVSPSVGISQVITDILNRLPLIISEQYSQHVPSMFLPGTTALKAETTSVD